MCVRVPVLAAIHPSTPLRVGCSLHAIHDHAGPLLSLPTTLPQHIEVIKYLQDKGAMMDETCFGTGTTPVMQAAKFGDLVSVKVR